MLQIVWRDCLTPREKFDFWFKHFNTLERVRLWNQLVFTREWFRRVVIYSRRQKSYLDAKAEQEKNKRNAEANKEKDEKNQEGENSEDNNASDEDDIDNSKIDSNKITYKGFHRRDVNEMLREYATTMYHNGVRTEELLLIQVRPDQKLEDIVTRENEGGTTSFFNKDTSQKQKDLKKRTDKFLHLTDLQELQQAREVFTPDEMLKMWNQFFVGSYFVEKDDKNKKDKSEIDVKEDGMDAEYRIIKLLDDEDYRNLEEKITTPKFQMWNNIQEQFDQRKTMDRYDQIHQFFQSMIQHNLKTLKSCESISKGQNDDIQEQDADEVIDSDDQANGGGSSVNKSESEISMDDNEPLLGPMRKQKKTKFELYKDVLSLVINEEERLPLWMLMTKEEKLDMLAHQCIDSEAQILSFLIEFEYGAENNFMAEGKNLQLDLLLEQSLNQMVFQKYLAYTRLQAAFYARKFTVDLIKTTRDESIKLYNYAEYLHDLNDRLKSKEKLNVTKIKNSKKNNGRDEQAFRRKAKDMIKNFKSLSDDDKESAALAMKLHFELDEANNEEKKKNQ